MITYKDPLRGCLCYLHVAPSTKEEVAQGYLAHKNPPLVGPYSSSMPRDLW